ncbi:hybrid sensor histidine kinase/response regulator [Desulfoplanes sp.]
MTDTLMDAFRKKDIIDSIPVIISVHDTNSNIVWANKAYLIAAGKTMDEIKGNKCYSIWNLDSRCAGCPVLQSIKTGMSHEAELTPQNQNNWPTTQGSWLSKAVPLKDDSGKVIGAIETAYDISKRIKAEEELKQSVENYRLIIANQKELVVKVDINGRFLFMSPSYCEMFGKKSEELLENKFMPLVHEENRGGIEDALESLFRPPYTTTVENYFMTKDGWRWLSWSATAVFDGTGRLAEAIWVGRDSTHRKQEETEKEKLRTQLQQAQKMESLGTLAGGIAHDFNNILSCIIGFAQLASRQVPETSAVSRHLKEIYQAGIRATDLVRQILTFSRKGETSKSPLMIVPVVKESLKLLRSTLPTSITLKEDIPPKVDMIMSNPTHIHQVIMNLCTNAAYSMEPSGGVLSVSIGHRELEPVFSRRYADLKPGRYLAIEISDTGCGIEPGILDEIFDPYFTTKDVGEGTGLGLAVVLGIVRDTGGDIAVHSTVGEGSTFTLFFPVAVEENQETAPERHASVRGGDEHILVVDDEPGLLKMYANVLEDLGYAVSTRTNGWDALETFKRDPDAFDLVLTDLTMPKMCGDQLAQKILRIKPGIPVILSTGFSKQIAEQKTQELGIGALLVKPVLPGTLALRIRKDLDASKDG